MAQGFRIIILLLLFFAAFGGFNLFADAPANAVAPINTAAPDNTVWKVDFSRSALPGVGVSTNFCWNIEDHLVFFSTDSRLNLKFSLPPGDYSAYKLKVTDSAGEEFMAAGDLAEGALYPSDVIETKLMVNINVNNKYAAYNVDINWVFDAENIYRAGKFLTPGANVITFTINPRSIIRYELLKVELVRN